MQEQIITIYGKNYKRLPELFELSCTGCSFKGEGCNAPLAYSSDCLNSIYVAVDTINPEANTAQKFTVDEFVVMVHDLQCYLPESIVEQLKAMTDPEYKQYLELKKKFG